MLTLAAANTIAGVASVATQLTCTIFGMELLAGVETYKVLDQRQLASSVATIYTVAGSTQAFVRSIHVVNNDVAARTFQLFINGTAAANAITPAINVPAGGLAAYEDEQGWKVYNSDGSLRLSFATQSTDSFFLTNEGMFLNGCIAGRLGAIASGPNANIVRTVALADALTTGAYTDFTMPADAVTSTVKIRPSWIAGSTDGSAHTVRWTMQIRIISSADVTSAGTAVAWTGDSATRTANVEVLETGQASTAVTPAAGDRVRLELQRVGGDGADTYVGIVHLRGIRVDYTASTT